MTCREFEADIVDLARKDSRRVPVAPRLSEHLRECPRCSNRLERERHLTAGLRAVADSVPSSSRTAAIEQYLLQVFAERQEATPTPVHVLAQHPSTRAARLWLAAAAVLVVATGAWLGSARWWPAAEVRSASASLAPHASNPVARGDSRETQPRNGPAAPYEELRAATPGVSGALRRVDTGVDRNQDEGVLRFVTLPLAVGLPRLESGRIVRVELATSMLAAYGFDVDPDVTSGIVEADVLVGQDNQPRAIRFVSLDSGSRRKQ